MTDQAKPVEEDVAPKKDAPAPADDGIVEKPAELNSVCELKDAEHRETSPPLKSISTPDILTRLAQAKNISLSETQCRANLEPQDRSTKISTRKTAELASRMQSIPEKREDAGVVKLDASATELSEGSLRTAKETMTRIDALLPPLYFGKYVRNGKAYNEPAPLSMEDEKKLRAIFATASENDLTALGKIAEKELVERFENDPRISKATKEALAIWIKNGKHDDDVAGKIARIALNHKDAELFNEAMSQASKTKRLEFTQEDLLKAFPDQKSKAYISASQYLEQGRISPFKQIEKNFGYLSDNRDAIKLAFSKLTAEDLETYRRGKGLSDSGSTLQTKPELMSKEERELYDLGAELQKGKIVEGLTPAKEQEAINRYKDVEALKIYKSLEHESRWAPAYMKEMDAIANYPDGKLATSIADLRTWVTGAPAVREVAKIIREMKPEDLQFYKKNPDRQEDINQMLEQLRLRPNDAMALQRYFKFVLAGSLSTAERALYRQPILAAFNAMGVYGRDMDTVVSTIQNMTEAEISRYKTDPKFREDLRAAVRGDDPEPNSPRYRRRDAMGQNQADLALRLLDKIDKNQPPNPDLVTKLQVNLIKRERDSGTVLKEIQTALSDAGLRARLQSEAPEDQAFKNAFMKAAQLNVRDISKYREIVLPTIANGSPPLDAVLKFGAGYWSTSPEVFESIASAPETARKDFAKNEALLNTLTEDLRPMALRIAKDGKFTDADRVLLGLSNTFSGSDLVIKTLEKISSDPKAVAQLKADFKKASPSLELEAALREKLSPMEFARAKFILTESASEREKYLTTLDLLHSSIKGWGSRWTESVFGSETRGQAIAAMNDYTAAEVAKVGQDLKDAVANDKVRQAVWKAIENHLTTRSDLMMYGGDAAGIGVPAAGAFAAYLLGAEVTVPLSAILVMGGVLSRMGVRQGALGDFYDTRTKNLIIDTITSTVLSATAFLGPGEIANLLRLGERAGAQAATNTQRILMAVEGPGNPLNLVAKPELEKILATQSQEIVKRAMLGASKSFDDRLIMSTAENLVRTEGFANAAVRQDAVNQVFNAIKTSLSQSYNVEANAFVRYGRAAGLDLAAGSTAGGTASVIDDVLHGKELGFHNLLASLQAALLAGTLGTAFRSVSQLRARGGNAKEAPVEAGPKGEKVTDTEYVYKPQSQNSAGNEVKLSPDHKTIEVKSKNGETVRKFDFDADTTGRTSISPREITVGEGPDKFTIKAVEGKPRLWQIERNGQISELQAEITVNPKDGSYTVKYVTDETASWFKTAYKDGQAPEKALLREVTYHADGRINYKGPTQDNWYPPEGSIFWKEHPQGEFWKTPDGKKTWITADQRIYREVFDNFFQASDSMFMEGKEAIKIKEVKATELDKDIQWINEGDTKWLDAKGNLKPEFLGPDGKIRRDLLDPQTGRLKGESPPDTYKSGEFVRIHTGRPDFRIIENGQIKEVDYYLAPIGEFRRAYKLLSGTSDTFVKTEKLVVRQIAKGEGPVKITSDGAEQIFVDGDYLVISDPTKLRGIKHDEFKRLYVDAPSKTLSSESFTLPPLEGPTVFDPATGVARAQWVKRVDGKPVEQGIIYWHNKEGIIRVVSEKETRVYNIASATAKGYRFYWADGSAEYVTPEGLRFTRKPGEKTWNGEDGSKLIEAQKTDLLLQEQFDPLLHLKANDNQLARNLGLGDRGRFADASNIPTELRAPDGTIRTTKLLGDNATVAVTEGPVTYVRTSEGTYRIEEGKPGGWFLDNNNILWNTTSTLKLTEQSLVLPEQIKFVSVGSSEPYTYTRNVHGQFWDFASAGAKWVDSSGKNWTRRPGDAEKTWVGEDGSVYVEGNWQYTPRSKHESRRAVQGASALGVLASLTRAASADELQKQGGLAEQIKRLRESGIELPQELLREVFKAAGRQAYDSVTQALKTAPYLVAGTEAQYHLRQMLYEANQRRSSSLRPEADPKADVPVAETKVEAIPAAPEIASGQLSDASIERISKSLEGYTRLPEAERRKAEFVQQTLLENLGYYHKVDPSKARGKTEAELKADYKRLVKESTDELLSAILIEQKRGFFGPASRSAYNEFMKWAQTEKGPALRKQIQEWQANVTPGQARSLIDEASGKTMSQELYMAKLLTGELKEEGILTADVRSISDANLAKFETVFNNLLTMSDQVQLQQLQNRELLLKQLIEKAGFPNGWLRKESEPLPEYLERVEKFVQLGTATRNTIDRLLDLWKRSNPPEFDFSLPPGTSIKMKGSNLAITNENLSTAEVQKLLREKKIELVDMGMSPELRWDHPPGAIQRRIDWLKLAKERTDKIEPILDEIRKNPEKIIMYQDTAVIGQAVKLDANNRFAGLVSPDAKPENPGEIISKEAGLLSYDYKVEKISSGPEAGKYKVTQTVQAYTAPPLAYQDIRALGMQAVGESTVVSEKVYSADDQVPVMNGTQVSYMKVSELENHRLTEMLSYYGHKTLTGAFDLSIAGSLKAGAGGIEAVTAMSAVEVAAASRIAAARSINLTARDTALQYSWWGVRATALGMAPLNSTGGQMLKINDMQVGAWINEGRGLFYLAEMGVGGLKMGYQKFLQSKYSGSLGTREAARIESGKLTGTEKIQSTLQAELPELMKEMKRLEHLNNILQAPMFLSLSSDIYKHKFGKKYDPVADASTSEEQSAHAQISKSSGETIPESKLPRNPGTELSFKEQSRDLLLSLKPTVTQDKLQSLESLIARVDTVLSKPEDKDSLEKLKSELIANLSFSGNEIRDLERVHPENSMNRPFKLSAKDIVALLDPEQRKKYPAPVQELATTILNGKDRDLSAFSQIAMLKLSRELGAEIEGELKIPAVYVPTRSSKDRSEQPAAAVATERSEKITLSTKQIARDLTYSSLGADNAAPSLLVANELYMSGKISANQMGAIYQDILDKPNSSYQDKLKALSGLNGNGLAWIIETMRNPSDPLSAAQFNSYKMGESEFVATLEKFAKSENQPIELRALAAAQFSILAKTSETIEKRRTKPDNKTTLSERAVALQSLNTEFRNKFGDASSHPENYVGLQREKLLSAITGATQNDSKEARWQQLNAANALLLLSNGSKDPETERLALKAIASSFNLQDAELAASVLKLMDKDKVKRLEELDKPAADLLRRQSLNLLSLQSRDGDETAVLQTLESVKRLFSEANPLTQSELKSKLVSLITMSPDNKDYANKLPALRARAIDTLAAMGAADAADIIREHAGTSASFVKNGTSFKFMEPDAQVRLSALSALEKLNPLVPQDRKLENYLSNLLIQESDPAVSASMEIMSRKLGLTQTESKLEDNQERTLAILMLQTLNDKLNSERGKKGWTDDASITSTWLKTNFDHLSREGLAKAAGLSADQLGTLSYLTRSKAGVQEEQKSLLLETMSRQFDELVDLAGRNDDLSNMAKRALYDIMTGKVLIPGTESNPLVVSGTYKLTLDGNTNWQLKAAEALSKIAKLDTSYKDLTNMFLLDGLLESRDPKVAAQIISGLEELVKTQSTRTSAFVSHRLDEYLQLKQVKEGISGEFVAKLLQFANQLDTHNSLNELEDIRRRSPYKEVRAEANRLILAKLDPIGTDLKIPVDRTVEESKKIDSLRDSLVKGESDRIAIAIRNLEGADLNAASAELQLALNNDDPRIKLLAADLVLGTSSLDLSHPLVQNALKETAILADQTSSPILSQDQLDSTKLRAETTLKKAIKLFSEEQAVSIKLESGKVLEIKRVSSELVLSSENLDKTKQRTHLVDTSRADEILPEKLGNLLKSKYSVLTAEGANKYAADNAGMLKKLLNSESSLMQEEKKNLLREMNSQFGKLAEHARPNTEAGQKAREVLYAIMSEKLDVPGSKRNPLLAGGSYQMTIDDQNWSGKAAEILTRIAKGEGPAAEQASSLLLEGLLESRNPEVSKTILAGIESIAASQPARTRALVAHRLSEYLELKEMKEGVQGSFIASLLEFSYKLNDTSLLSKLPLLRERSPYPEVREKARDLMIQNFDPLKNDLNAARTGLKPVDTNGTLLSDLRTKLREQADSKQMAEALLALQGKDLRFLANELSSTLQHSDPRIKLLSARLILDAKSAIPLSHTLAQQAIREVAALAFLNTPKTEDSWQDKALSLRRQSMDTLALLRDRLRQGEVLTLAQPDAQTERIELRKIDGNIELAHFGIDKSASITYSDGRSMHARLENGKLIVNRNGIEYIEAGVNNASYWKELNTGLVILTPPDKQFTKDMELRWHNIK